MDLVLAPRACFPPPTQCVVGTSAPLDAGLQLAAVVYLSPFETSSAAPRSYRHPPPTSWKSCFAKWRPCWRPSLGRPVRIPAEIVPELALQWASAKAPVPFGTSPAFVFPPRRAVDSSDNS